MATIKKMTKYMLGIPLPKQAVQLGKPAVQPYLLQEISGSDLQNLLCTNDPKLDGAIAIETQTVHYLKLKRVSILELEDAPNVRQPAEKAD